MADAKNTPGYRQGGEEPAEDEGWDTVGDNPTGFPRKSSARQRRKKSRRLFGGTPWAKSVAVAGALVLGAALTGCGAHGLDGDPGRVADKDRDYSPSTKTWDYDLQVRRPDGTTYWIDVSHGVYQDCKRGSSYPSCGK